jgi:hypothetical protein
VSAYVAGSKNLKDFKGWPPPDRAGGGACRYRDFFIDNLLVRIHFFIEMIRWTGLAPWKFEFPLPGSLTSTFLT